MLQLKKSLDQMKAGWRVFVRDHGQRLGSRNLGTVLDTGSGLGLNSLNERFLLRGGSLDILSRHHSRP